MTRLHISVMAWCARWIYKYQGMLGLEAAETVNIQEALFCLSAVPLRWG